MDGRGSEISDGVFGVGRLGGGVEDVGGKCFRCGGVGGLDGRKKGGFCC